MVVTPTKGLFDTMKENGCKSRLYPWTLLDSVHTRTTQESNGMDQERVSVVDPDRGSTQGLGVTAMSTRHPAPYSVFGQAAMGDIILIPDRCLQSQRLVTPTVVLR